MHVHSGDHNHAHDLSRKSARRRMGITLAILFVYMVAEFAGGIWTGSLALLSDAGHMLSDVAALSLSLFALWVARRPPNPARSYGYYRAEILAALVNGAALIALAVMVFREAWTRLSAPPEILAGPMIAVAAGGLVVNLVALWLLESGRKDSLNVRGAWLHVLGDTLGSVGVITAGALMWGFGWYWADPIASIMVAILIVYSSIRLLKEAVSVLMEGTPAHIDPDKVRHTLRVIPAVQDIHDLHIWTITSGMESMSCHVVASPDAAGPLLREIRETLAREFRITHITIQIETEPMDEDCCNS
jgi:cobalt-zinc-cadmium efflux system protein